MQLSYESNLVKRVKVTWTVGCCWSDTVWGLVTPELAVTRSYGKTEEDNRIPDMES